MAAQVISSRRGLRVPAGEFDPALLERLSVASAAELLILPVALKGTIAAVLLAIPKHVNTLEALETLILATQLVIDVQAYRKTEAAAKSADAASTTPAAAASTPAPAVVAKPTPPPTPAAAAAPARPAVAPESSVVRPPEPSPAPPSLDELHDKARRFAKLLVEEIKLYNQTKVTEGRAKASIYSLLREDIEKSRNAYRTRYGESVKDADYFNQELVRILADNNPAAMGEGFTV
jgi:hypothetical protein